MRALVPALTILVLGSFAFAGEIRQFNVPTLERLGNELTRRDHIAAVASGVVLDSQPAARALKMRGWITELGKSQDKVYLIAETASGLCLAYIVSFRGSEQPQVEDRRGQPLPPDVAVRFKARQTALAALTGKFFDASYNFEVLSDPEDSGFLVYGLACTNKEGEEITGGHFRVTVSSDGSKAERVDALSRGIIKDTPKLPKGATQMAIATSQLVSNVPVETFIYTSNLYRLPMYVATKDGSTWRIANGKIHKFSKVEIEAMEKDKKK